MEIADRIPFAAARGLRKSLFTWREGLTSKDEVKVRGATTVLITVIAVATMLWPQGHGGPLARVYGPLVVIVVYAGIVALKARASNLTRTDPFSGYLGELGVVVEIRGTETLLAWSAFAAHEASANLLSLQLKEARALPRLFGRPITKSSWLPLAKHLFAADDDWQKALVLAGEKLNAGSPDRGR